MRIVFLGTPDFAVKPLEAIKLVNLRGKFMTQDCSGIGAGMMVVLGLSNEKVEEICKNSNKQIYNVYPIKSKEEYEARLSEFTFDRKGMVDDNLEYDHVLGEYLLFYGDKVSYEEKERYLLIIYLITNYYIGY